MVNLDRRCVPTDMTQFWSEDIWKDLEQWFCFSGFARPIPIVVIVQSWLCVMHCRKLRSWTHNPLPPHFTLPYNYIYSKYYITLQVLYNSSQTPSIIYNSSQPNPTNRSLRQIINSTIQHQDHARTHNWQTSMQAAIITVSPKQAGMHKSCTPIDAHLCDLVFYLYLTHSMLKAYT